jgi:hypothetical protein
MMNMSLLWSVDREDAPYSLRARCAIAEMMLVTAGFEAVRQMQNAEVAHAIFP